VLVKVSVFVVVVENADENVECIVKYTPVARQRQQATT
jgi:hypothetical protein